MPADPQPGPMTALVTLVVFVCLGTWAWALSVRLRQGGPLLTGRPVPKVPWGGGGPLLAFALWVGLQFFAGGILFGIVGRRKPTLVELMAVTSAVNLAVIALLPAALSALAGARPRHFGLRAGHLAGDLARGVVAGLLFTPAVYAVQVLAVQVWEPIPHPLMEMLQRDRSVGVALLAFASAVVLAPVAEELMFRVVFQGWLEKRAGPGPEAVLPRTDEVEFEDEPTGRAGPGDSAPAIDDPAEVASEGVGPVERISPREARLAGPLPIFISSLVFAGVHFGQWPAPIPLFLLSLGLGLVYRRTGGLVAPAAMHATFNGISTLLMFAALESGALPVPVEPDEPAAEAKTPPIDGAVVLDVNGLLNPGEDGAFPLARRPLDK